ncbi:DUF6415 family natural product biosynthesis protein [Streptomyces sp. NPDC051907]|uniref:DUF6415 family natural product biosynthesis protein n=1 Tax=Streptomyces sp. NPDC051907 TaxID=3155284 RepID=UPI003418A583
MPSIPLDPEAELCTGSRGVAAQKWEPPLDPEGLMLVLAKMRVWNPLVLESVFDDLDKVLGDCLPATGEIEELAERLRGALLQLLNITVADPQFQPDEAMAEVLERARHVISLPLPGGYWPAVGQLRRMSWVASTLLDRLIASSHINETS